MSLTRIKPSKLRPHSGRDQNVGGRVGAIQCAAAPIIDVQISGRCLLRKASQNLISVSIDQWLGRRIVDAETCVRFTLETLTKND